MKYRRTEPLIFGEVPRHGRDRRSFIVRCPKCETRHEVAWAAPSQSQDKETTPFDCFGCGEVRLETPDIPERVGFRIDLAGPERQEEPISFAQEARRTWRLLSRNTEATLWWIILALCLVGFVYLWTIKAHVVGKELLWLGRMGILLAPVAGFFAWHYRDGRSDEEAVEIRIMLVILLLWASPAVIEYVHRFSCPGFHF
ncbi:MAG TPA: hypothetical protein PKA58_24215 [Polyangium sp.]|nr:hypothetical protein [Polyangium sp.]